MEFSGYHQLLQRCRQHVILGRARANTVDFAKLAAAQLVPVVHVPVDENSVCFFKSQSENPIGGRPNFQPAP